MKKNMVLICIMVCVVTFPACTSVAEGPTTWIDQPLDNSIFPLQPITLQAHASDSDGVGVFDFLVDDTHIMSVNASGGRLENAIIEWQPNLPGEYIIGIRAVDNGGHEGPVAFSRVQIFFPEVLEVTSEQIDSSEFTSDVENEPEEEDPIQPAGEQPPEVVANQGINCRSGPGMDYGVSKVLQPNDPARVVGRLSNNTWLQLAYPGSSVECWVAANIVTITGNLGEVSVSQVVPLLDPPLPEAPEPEPEPEEPPPPPEDTTAPTITSVSISPSLIYQEGCYGETTTTTIYVEVIDIGGIATIEVAWSGGSLKLTHTSGYTYSGVVGPFSNKGTVSFHGSAVDTSGNWTPFTASITVDCCIC